MVRLLDSAASRRARTAVGAGALLAVVFPVGFGLFADPTEMRSAATSGAVGAVRLERAAAVERPSEREIADRLALVGAAVSRSTPTEPPAPVPVAQRRWVRPADGGRTGWFGERRGGRAHGGLDLDGETGDPVWAATSGTVTWAGPAPAGYGGYGNVVLIDHGEGVETLYSHLDQVLTTVGRAVEPAEIVGTIGTSGNVTGSHLHFEVRVGGVPVDPESYLPPPAA